MSRVRQNLGARASPPRGGPSVEPTARARRSDANTHATPVHLAFAAVYAPYLVMTSRRRPQRADVTRRLHAAAKPIAQIRGGLTRGSGWVEIFQFLLGWAELGPL